MLRAILNKKSKYRKPANANYRRTPNYDSGKPETILVNAYIPSGMCCSTVYNTNIEQLLETEVYFFVRDLKADHTTWH